MDSIILNNNSKEDSKEIDVEIDDQDSADPNAGSVSPPSEGGAQPSLGSSFLKFSIQNILQQAAVSNGAAAIAAAASRRSSELIHPDMAAVMNDFDMKRAMGALPFW